MRAAYILYPSGHYTHRTSIDRRSGATVTRGRRRMARTTHAHACARGDGVDRLAASARARGGLITSHMPKLGAYGELHARWPSVAKGMEQPPRQPSCMHDMCRRVDRSWSRARPYVYVSMAVRCC